MERIVTALGAAAALALLAGCAGNGAYGNGVYGDGAYGNGSYYGGGYSSARSERYGYRQPYPYNNYDRRVGNSYYPRDSNYYYDGRNYYRR
jgi:hypothetical protein